jgi:hypothetical protein
LFAFTAAASPCKELFAESAVSASWPRSMQAPLGPGALLTEGADDAVTGEGAMDGAMDGTGAIDELAPPGEHAASANTRTIRRTLGITLPPRQEPRPGFSGRRLGRIPGRTSDETSRLVLLRRPRS